MTAQPLDTWGFIHPVIDPRVRSLCLARYPGHPKGCPNYGRKRGCPPAAPLIGELIDLRRPVLAVWNVFPLAEHVAEMRRRHPTWSDRQLHCCLYWQPRARRQLSAMLRHALQASRLRNPRILAAPEAHGVNVTETMRQLNIALEWPPRQLAYQVAMVGERK